MTIARTMTATAALLLAIAFSPVQAAPLSGTSAQSAGTSLSTPIAVKSKKMHATKRRHHRMHSKRHKGCSGAYMYHSRKSHRCMDSRNK